MCGIYGVRNVKTILYCMYHLHATVLHIGSITKGLEQWMTSRKKLPVPWLELQKFEFILHYRFWQGIRTVYKVNLVGVQKVRCDKGSTVRIWDYFSF